MIGRVQEAFATLLISGFGLAIYLLPTIVPGASEAPLYMACEVIIVICVGVARAGVSCVGGDF